MMSAVFPIAVNSEKVIARVPASEEERSDGLSFAENIKESVELPAELSANTREESSRGETAFESKNPVNRTAADPSTKVPGGVPSQKGKFFASPEKPIQIPTQAGLILKKTNQLDKVAVDDSGEAATIEEVATKNGNEVSTTMTTNDSVKAQSPSTSVEPASVPRRLDAAEELPTETAQAVSTAPQIHNETLSVSKSQESTSAKKTAKAESSPVAQFTRPVVPNGLCLAVHSTGESKAPQPVAINDVTPGEMPVVVVAAAPQSATAGAAPVEKNVSLTTASGDVAARMGGVTNAGVRADGSERRDISNEKSSSTADDQLPIVPPTDKVVSTMVDQAPERLAVSSAGIGQDGDISSQPVTGAALAAVHAMAPGEAALQTVVAGVVTTPESGAVKLQAGDAVISNSTTTRHEQDGSSLVEGSMEAMPRMLAATPAALEVGIQNGTHGWLKVRAEMSEGGVVNAAVSASSSTGQEMLHRELPSLTSYLSSEKVAVNVVVTPSIAAQDDRSGVASGMESGGGQTPERSGQEGQGRESLLQAASDSSEEATRYQSLQDADMDGTLLPSMHGGGRSWLSVRA